MIYYLMFYKCFFLVRIFFYELKINFLKYKNFYFGKLYTKVVSKTK